MQERDRFIQSELKANLMIWYAKSIQPNQFFNLVWQIKFGLANSVHFSNSVWQFSLVIRFDNLVQQLRLAL
jgi:hypothetical protein